MLIWTNHFSHVALQVVAFEDLLLARLLLLLLMLTVANLLLVHARKLLRSALLDRIWLQAIHIVRCDHLLTVLLASRRRLPSLVCVLYRAFSPHECVQVELVWRC